MDVVDQKTRSKMMSGIRGRNTKPEIAVRKALHAAGFRFRLHRRDLPGSPDVVMPGRKVAIFVHGCFWHRHENCRFAKLPSSRADFWRLKLEGNAERDRRNQGALRTAGWRVLTVWECAIRDRKTLATLSQALAEWINSPEPVGEIRDGWPHPET